MNTRTPSWLFAFALVGMSSFQALASEPKRDPVAVIERSPDYLEQRVRGVGLGAWGGPMRMDLEIDPTTHQPIRSFWMDRALFATGDDPFAGVRHPFVPRPPSAAGRLIIEAGRRLSADELSIAGKPVAEGRVVRVLAESTTRTADFLVDGVATELKTVSQITSADLSGALARRILEGAGQGEHIIVDARRQAGLTYELAVRAIQRAYGVDKYARRITLIRIIAESFDLTLPPG